MGITLLQSHIDEFLLVKDAEGLSKSCHRKYEFNLTHFIKWVVNEELTKQKILEFIQILIGHESIEMTKHYINQLNIEV